VKARCGTSCFRLNSGSAPVLTSRSLSSTRHRPQHGRSVEENIAPIAGAICSAVGSLNSERGWKPLRRRNHRHRSSRARSHFLLRQWDADRDPRGRCPQLLLRDRPSPRFFWQNRGGPLPLVRALLGHEHGLSICRRDAFYSFNRYNAHRSLADVAILPTTAAPMPTYQGARVPRVSSYTAQFQVLCPTLGNQTGHSTAFVDTYPYLQMFTVCRRMEKPAASRRATGTLLRFRFWKHPFSLSSTR